MLKEILLASSIAIVPNNSIRRLNGDQFAENQESYSQRFSLTNFVSENMFFFDFNEQTIYVTRYIDIDRNNQLIRYSFEVSSYNVDTPLVENEYILNDYLINISEDIEEQYFYISYNEYLEIDTDIRMYCSSGTIYIYDYENDNYFGSKDSRISSFSFDVPEIFTSQQVNYYINLNQNTDNNEEIERLEGIIEELEIKISTLENAKRNLEEQNATLSENNTNLQNQIIVLNQYKTQLESEVNTLQNNYNEIYSLYENLIVENDTLEEENNNLRNQIIELEKNQIVGNTFGSVIKIISDNASALLETEILPNFTIGNIIFIPVIFSLLGIIFKFFRR